MESTPVVGVDTRKLNAELLLAPSFLREDASGITPQEQTGSGIPKIVALKTDPSLEFPRCLMMKSFPRNVCTSPAKNRPVIKYGAIESHREIVSLIKVKKNSKTKMPAFLFTQIKILQIYLCLLRIPGTRRARDFPRYSRKAGKYKHLQFEYLCPLLLFAWPGRTSLNEFFPLQSRNE